MTISSSGASRKGGVFSLHFRSQIPSGFLLDSSLLLSLFLLAASVYQTFADEDAYWDDRFGDLPLEGSVEAIGVRGDDVYIGGTFRLQKESLIITNVARWNGNEWFNLGAGLTTEFPSGARLIALEFFGERVVAGGSFSRSGDDPLRGVAQWDGDRWSAFGEGLNGGALAVAIAPQGLFAGGFFPTLGSGIPANHVAFWDGRQWFPLGTGVRYPIEGPHGTRDFAQVMSMLLIGERLIVGGAISEAGPLSVSNIAQWDGREWSAMGEGLNGLSRGLAVHDGMVHAAGWFARPNQPPVLLARWNGTEWEYISGPEVILGATAHASAATHHELFIGGQKFEINGSGHVARFVQGQWSGLGSGTDSGVFALEARNGLLYVGGYFNTAGGKPARGFSIYHLPRTLKVDRLEQGLRISWPKPDTDFVLERTDDLADPRWEVVPDEPFLSENRWTVLQPLREVPQFYRLRELGL